MLVLNIDLCVGILVLVLTGRLVCLRLGVGVDGSLVCWRLGVGVDGSTCVLEAGCWC